MPISPFRTDIAEQVWNARYRYTRDATDPDNTPADTWTRVAAAASACEGDRRSFWETTFTLAMSDLGFLPGGRILAGAGRGRQNTLSNCFVMGSLRDDLVSIFGALSESAQTLQAGGGIGLDFSPLKPASRIGAGSGDGTPGPIACMRLWDAMCETVSSTGIRRGAMMATLHAGHPDIFEFVTAKADRRSLSHFNCSVLIPEAFMTTLEADGDWPLIFQGTVHRHVSARTLWNAVMHSTWESSEPGVLFIDRINTENNLAWREQLSATNPCGEVPLPPYGACHLGSLNLTRFVQEPFTPHARFDRAALATRVVTAIRMLDNLIDVSGYPLPAQRQESLATRRVGLGFMGLGSALIMLGLRYDSLAARNLAAGIARTIRDNAYAASIRLATDKGSFPAFDAARYTSSPFIRRLPAELQADIARHGIRNSHLLAIAPTGSISLLADNVSGGIEPVFRTEYRRMVRTDDTVTSVTVEDFARRSWRDVAGPDLPLPSSFVTADTLEPSAHLAMQAAVQPYIDQAISKTINLSQDTTFAAFCDIYRDAHRLGLKGVTTFRPHSDRPGVLSACS